MNLRPINALRGAAARRASVLPSLIRIRLNGAKAHAVRTCSGLAVNEAFEGKSFANRGRVQPRRCIGSSGQPPPCRALSAGRTPSPEPDGCRIRVTNVSDSSYNAWYLRTGSGSGAGSTAPTWNGRHSLPPVPCLRPYVSDAGQPGNYWDIMAPESGAFRGVPTR